MQCTWLEPSVGGYNTSPGIIIGHRIDPVKLYIIMACQCIRDISGTTAAARSRERSDELWSSRKKLDVEIIVTTSSWPAELHNGLPFTGWSRNKEIAEQLYKQRHTIAGECKCPIGWWLQTVITFTEKPATTGRHSTPTIHLSILHCSHHHHYHHT